VIEPHSYCSILPTDFPSRVLSLPKSFLYFYNGRHSSLISGRSCSRVYQHASSGNPRDSSQLHDPGLRRVVLQTVPHRRLRPGMNRQKICLVTFMWSLGLPHIWNIVSSNVRAHIMDKLKLTGRNLGRVFNCRLGRACIGHAIVHVTKQPNLKLKTRPKQLLGSLPLAFACAPCQFSLNFSRTLYDPHFGCDALYVS